MRGSEMMWDCFTSELFNDVVCRIMVRYATTGLKWIFKSKSHVISVTCWSSAQTLDYLIFCFVLFLCLLVGFKKKKKSLAPVSNRHDGWNLKWNQTFVEVRWSECSVIKAECCVSASPWRRINAAVPRLHNILLNVGDVIWYFTLIL